MKWKNIIYKLENKQKGPLFELLNETFNTKTRKVNKVFIFLALSKFKFVPASRN